MMGLFDVFKKKKEEPQQNNVNSVFTLRFTVPYFQVFDKTDRKLSALPIKMSVSGSCQYRIADPELCFDNVPLKQMSPSQLEAHVKDAMTMHVKKHFNSINGIPVLQFESAIEEISTSTKTHLTSILNDEFGINLRAFSISSVRYDTEDANYQSLQRYSQNIAKKRADIAGELEDEDFRKKSKAEGEVADILGCSLDDDFNI